MYRMLRRAPEPKKEQVAADCTELYNEYRYNSHVSSNIIIVIKSRKMTCAGHAARMGEMKNVYNIFVENPEGK
jgi:hypothetical protein